jgi:hypothetical protein
MASGPTGASKLRLAEGLHVFVAGRTAAKIDRSSLPIRDGSKAVRC